MYNFDTKTCSNWVAAAVEDGSWTVQSDSNSYFPVQKSDGNCDGNGNGGGNGNGNSNGNGNGNGNGNSN